jgi:hypothetical protein
MRIYITHCCAKKDDTLKGTGVRVTPDKLYKGKRTKTFMGACTELGVHWAIFSDKHGIWFPNVAHEWYDKHPNRVSEKDFARLVDDFDAKLKQFDEIWFYRDPRRFHRLYRRLLVKAKLCDRIHQFSELDEIG